MSESDRILSDILNRFDRNNDDMVHKSEMKQSLEEEIKDKNLPHETAQIIGRSVFSNWDSDDDDKLTMSELKKLADKWACYPGDQSA